MQSNQTPSTGNGSTTSPAPATFTVSFPTSATFTFAGRSQPVVVLGLAPRGELRIVDADGHFRSVAEFRVRLERAS